MEKLAICNGNFHSGTAIPIARFVKEKKFCKMCTAHGKDKDFMVGKCFFCKSKHDCSFGTGKFCSASCVGKYGYHKRMCKKNTKKTPTTLVGFIKKKLSTVKRRSVLKGRKTDITFDYLYNLWENQNGKCALSGISMQLKNKHSTQTGYDVATLDRIDSCKGYVKGNVQWTVNQVNFGKNDYEQRTFSVLAIKTSVHQIANRIIPLEEMFGLDNKTVKKLQKVCQILDKSFNDKCLNGME